MNFSENKANCFKYIEGYHGLYYILDNGKVWSVKRKSFLEPTKGTNPRVHLTKDKIEKREYVYKLLKDNFGEELANEFKKNNRN